MDILKKLSTLYLQFEFDICRFNGIHVVATYIQLSGIEAKAWMYELYHHLITCILRHIFSLANSPVLI